MVGPVRRLPQPGAVIAALRTGTIVQLTGRRQPGGLRAWVEGVLSVGRVAWVPAVYLVPDAAYRAP